MYSLLLQLIVIQEDRVSYWPLVLLIGVGALVASITPKSKQKS